MMRFKDEKRIKKLYNNLFRKFKYSYKSLDWGSKKNQKKISLFMEIF